MEHLEARITSELQGAFEDLRSQLSLALASIPLSSPLVVDNTVSPTRSSHFDLPPPGSYPPSAAASSNFPFRQTATSVPSTSRLRRDANNDDANGSRTPGLYTVPGAGGGEADGDELPAYSARPRLAPLDDAPRRMHAYMSRSGKLRLEVMAAGEAHILLTPPIEGEGDGKIWVQGQLKLSLPQPESITHIKIRLKGVIQTMVMRVHGSGRHPVTEDILIWEDAQTLWTAPPELPRSATADLAKLHGDFSFPFRLYLPPRVTLSNPSRRVRIPPSFILATDQGGQGGKGTEWASCRYFIKVTLGRKGLLKVNERIVVPVIHSPRAPPPEGSPLRLAAIASNRPPPGPLEDPAGWAGKKIRQPVKRGIFAGKKAWYEVVLLLPSPAKFSRLTSIQFAIKIVSSDPGTTTQFPLSAISVFLIQRTLVTAQGLSGTHDIVISQTTPTVDGPEDGTWIPQHGKHHADPDEPVWGKRFQGGMTLGQGVSSTFKAPNLSVQFLLAVRVAVPGQGNDSELSWPIEVLPSPPPPPPVQRRPPGPAPIPIVGPPLHTEGLEGGEGVGEDPSLELGLPPSYFEVGSAT